MNKCLVVFFINFTLNILGQNLILNSSFTDVALKQDSNSFYMLLPEKLSQVKYWYLPEYINHEKLFAYDSSSPKYSSVYYYTSLDKDLVIKKKLYSNGDQLFEKNLGFVQLYLSEMYPVAVLQQKLQSKLLKGDYCFKFKYKYIALNSSNKNPPKLEISISRTNLREYYSDELKVPEKLVQISFRDSSKFISDKNTPWQQFCYNLKLDGDEQYISIGTLKNIKNGLRHAVYYIDEIELYRVNIGDSCSCEKINKDLKTKYKREFPLNKAIISDTLVLFNPHNNWAPFIISPDAKYYLNTIIAFLQRHPKLKIKWLEYVPDISTGSFPSEYQIFERYMIFYGIDKRRILGKLCLCKSNNYCGLNSQYTKFGFIIY